LCRKAVVLLTLFLLSPLLVTPLTCAYEEIELVKNSDFSAGLLHWSINNELLIVAPFMEDSGHTKYEDPVLQFYIDYQKPSGTYYGSASQSFYLPKTNKAVLSFIYFDSSADRKVSSLRVKVVGSKTGETILTNWFIPDGYGYEIHNLSYDLTTISDQNITLLIELQVQHSGGWLGWTDVCCIDDVSVKYTPLPYTSVQLIEPTDGAHLTSSPVILKARCTSDGSGIEGATVKFYVDGIQIGLTTCDYNGYASYSYLSSEGFHNWYAIAEKNGYNSGMSATWDFTYSQPEKCSVTFYAAGLGSEATDIILTVDGMSYKCSQLPITFEWDSGSTHSYSWSSPMVASSGKRYVWASTSGLAIVQSSSITISYDGSISASYKTQYYITMDVNLRASGTIFPGTGWYDASSQFEVFVNPKSGYLFLGWSTSGGISITSTISDTTSVTVSGGGAIIARMEQEPMLDLLREWGPVITIVSIVLAIIGIVIRVLELRRKRVRQ